MIDLKFEDYEKYIFINREKKYVDLSHEVYFCNSRGYEQEVYVTQRGYGYQIYIDIKEGSNYCGGWAPIRYKRSDYNFKSILWERYTDDEIKHVLFDNFVTAVEIGYNYLY